MDLLINTNYRRALDLSRKGLRRGNLKEARQWLDFAERHLRLERTRLAAEKADHDRFMQIAGVRDKPRG